MSDHPLFHTDPIGLVVVAVFVGLPILGFWWIDRRVDRLPPSLKRRLTDPQRGSAPGTGVEPRSDLTDSAALLPRSPQTSAGVAAPRPAASAGLKSPSGRGGTEHPPVAFAGLHAPMGVQWPVASIGPERRPVIIHEW